MSIGEKVKFLIFLLNYLLE
ncbi:unnamed protein product [Oikopleura dioica]|uniref:Uncharacterized protein n=1 Tax=Oikopleura dioica TaxID=34765 RepID=E4Z1L2_OIKDI|nr:unnamed protein product [Oikopleura dioica]